MLISGQTTLSTQTSLLFPHVGGTTAAVALGYFAKCAEALDRLSSKVALSDVVLTTATAGQLRSPSSAPRCPVIAEWWKKVPMLHSYWTT